MLIPFLSVTIPSDNIITLFAVGLICSLGFPLLFVLLRNKLQLKFIPFIVGAATYMVLVLFGEAQLRMWIIDPDSPLYNAMVSNPALYMFVIGFGTGIVVEGGKYAVFYFLKRWYSSRQTATAFQLGYCTIHMLFFVGIRYIVYGWLATNQNRNMLLGAQSLDYPELFRSLAYQSPIDILVVSLEGLLYCAVTFGLTFLVWYSATRPFKLYFLYTAVLLHSSFYAPYALTEVHVLKTSTIYYTIISIIAVISLFIAFSVSRADIRSKSMDSEPDLFSS